MFWRVYSSFKSQQNNLALGRETFIRSSERECDAINISRPANRDIEHSIGGKEKKSLRKRDRQSERDWEEIHKKKISRKIGAKEKRRHKKKTVGKIVQKLIYF